MIKELSVDFGIKECCQALRFRALGTIDDGERSRIGGQKENAELLEADKGGL